MGEQFSVSKESIEDKKKEFLNNQNKLINEIADFLRKQENLDDAVEELEKGNMNGGVSTDIVRPALEKIKDERRSIKNLS